MIQDLDRLGPVLAVMITAGVLILIDLVMSRESRRLLVGLALAGLGVAALWLVSLILRDREAAFFYDSMVLDDYTIFFTFMFLGVSAAVIVASWEFLERFGQRQAEFLALMLIATSGMMLLSGSRDLVAIFIALELTSITQFILVGFLRDDKGSEAAIKYLLLGAVSSAVILYGMAFLYGIAGTTRIVTTDGSPSIADAIASGGAGVESAVLVSIVFLVAGFGFKMAIVPFQMWTPDVYQGAPTPVAAFLSVGSKAAAFAVVLRIFYEGFGTDSFVTEDWKVLFAVIAAISMTLGNIMALRQTNIRRMLGYSSIAQAGNILVGVAAVSDGGSTGPTGVLFYLAAYTITNLGAFFAVMAISSRTGSDEIADYAGMGRRAPVPALVLLICLLSLTGLPPTAGFFAKVFVFNAAVQADLVWLVFIGVVNTVVSAFYYLGVARQMYLSDAEGQPALKFPAAPQGVLLVAGGAVIVFSVVPWVLIDAAERAVNVFA
jgi:NADH-quinone oxidoreductase subunit N